VLTHARLLFQSIRSKNLLVCGTQKLGSKFGEDQSINDVTILSTDAGHPTSDNGQWILYSVQCYALHWTYN